MVMEEEVSFLASQTNPQLQPLLYQHPSFCNNTPTPRPPPSFDASTVPLTTTTTTTTDSEPSTSSSVYHPPINERNKIHRCKTAPALSVMRDLIKPRNPKPAADSNSLVGQAFLLLLLYLSLGVLIFSVNRLSFSGHRTHPLVDALYFCIVTMCTIGYGDIAPLSPFAKLFSCFFVLVGFGFIDILLSGVVNHVLDLQENMILKEVNKSRSKSSSSSEEGGRFRARNYIVDVQKGRMRIRLKVGLALGIVMFCIGIGTVVLYFGEELSLIDSVYLSVMSVTTVGYGDRAFKTIHGRLFASIWLLFSTLAVARAFLYLAEARIDKRHRRIAKWVLQRDITVDDLRAANLNNNAFISRSEYVVYKLKEMGKIREKDVIQICEQFNKLDHNNSGKITLPDLMQDHHHHHQQQ